MAFLKKVKVYCETKDELTTIVIKLSVIRNIVIMKITIYIQ